MTISAMLHNNFAQPKNLFYQKKGRRGPFFEGCYRFFGFAGRTNIGTGVGQTWAKFGT